MHMTKFSTSQIKYNHFETIVKKEPSFNREKIKLEINTLGAPRGIGA